MFRNHCARIETLSDGKRTGMLIPGAMLFILDHDGGEGEKYKVDGIGNASHIGVYVGASDTIYSVDASSSAHKVRSRTKRDAEKIWTHVAWFKEVDYTMYQTTSSDSQGSYQSGLNAGVNAMPVQDAQQSQPLAPQPTPIVVQVPTYTVSGYPYLARVSINGEGRLIVRTAPRIDDKTFNGNLEPGTDVEVLDDYSTAGWAQIRYDSKTYWCQAQYLVRMPTQSVGQVQTPNIQQQPAVQQPFVISTAQYQPGYTQHQQHPLTYPQYPQYTQPVQAAPTAPQVEPTEQKPSAKDKLQKDMLNLLFKNLLGDDE